MPEELSDYITLVWNEDVIAAGKGVNVWNNDGELTTVKPAEGDGRFHVMDAANRGYQYEVFAWKTALTTTDPGNETDNLLVGVKLNEWVNYVDGKYYDMSEGNLDHPIEGLENLKVVVTGHAIQADGIADWWTAYNNYMGQWSEWRLEMPSSSTGKIYTESTTVNEYIVLPDGDENSDCVTASGEDTVVIINGGMYDIGVNYNPCAVWAKDGATVEIHNGDFWCDAREIVNSGEHIDLIYAGASNGGNPTKGTILIYGGCFGADGSTPENPGAWLLNAKDGYGEIIVMGGDFYNWNPAGNTSEGNPTNFVADGYGVWLEIDEGGNHWYRVREDSEENYYEGENNGWTKVHPSSIIPCPSTPPRGGRHPKGMRVVPFGCRGAYL